MVACLQGSDAGQKCVKISRIFNFGVQLWLTRIRSDLVTADRPIKLESTDHIGIDPGRFSPVSIAQPFRPWRSVSIGRFDLDPLQNRTFWPVNYPLQNRTFWPVNYQISTKLSPNLTEHCGYICACPMPSYLQGWLGKGRQSTHRKYKVHILNGRLSTGLRCRSKMC